MSTNPTALLFRAVANDDPDCSLGIWSAGGRDIQYFYVQIVHETKGELLRVMLVEQDMVALRDWINKHLRSET